MELENNPAELSKAVTARTIDALGANRQRLTTLSTATPGTRLLADDLFNVPQNIVVPKNRPAPLAAVNALIDEVRVSGLLRSAIERGGAIGVAVAPAGVKAGCPGHDALAPSRSSSVKFMSTAIAARVRSVRALRAATPPRRRAAS